MSPQDWSLEPQSHEMELCNLGKLRIHSFPRAPSSILQKHCTLETFWEAHPHCMQTCSLRLRPYGEKTRCWATPWREFLSDHVNHPQPVLETLWSFWGATEVREMSEKEKCSSQGSWLQFPMGQHPQWETGGSPESEREGVK